MMSCQGLPVLADMDNGTDGDTAPYTPHQGQCLPGESRTSAHLCPCSLCQHLQMIDAQLLFVVSSFHLQALADIVDDCDGDAATYTLHLKQCSRFLASYKSLPICVLQCVCSTPSFYL